VHDRRCRPGCAYAPLTEPLCYFHQKVADGLIDGYFDLETDTWVRLP
jgi:hypothetical protein